ncbi:MAG: efflux RND transporter periplasmic adaptor subunit [Halanaerobiales bacterium]|nr:efflux RND transporter periplasmic adaptor subunit [Halanaerobiales bacterium]
MKKAFIIILVLAVLVAGGWYFLSQRNGNTAKTSNTNILNPQNLYTVQKASFNATISSNGRIKPVEEKDLYFLTSGRVEEIKFEEGDIVKEGQLLATLDNLSEELSLARAKNNYDQAMISSTSTVKKEKLLEYQIAEKNYNNTFLYAPFSGLITSVDVEVNDQVNMSRKIIHLIDNSSYIIELNIDEVDLSQIEKNQKVTIVLEAYPDMLLRGEITKIGLVAENQGGVVMIPVEVKVPTTDPRVKSGLSASAEIIVGQVKNELVVPVTAVTEKNGKSIIMKKEGDTVKPVKVTTGISNDIMISVVDGLDEGDQIVANNFTAISAIRDPNLNSMQGMFKQGAKMGGQR